MLVICLSCMITLILAVIFIYGKASATLNKVDGMIDQAIEGSLSENEFSEKKASRSFYPGSHPRQKSWIF